MLVAALCAAGSPVHAADNIRIDEFNITCVNGFPNAAFVELTAAGADQVYDNGIKLRFLNSNGTTRYEVPIGVSALAGQSWPQGRRWLIGFINFFGTTQVVPDAEMTNVPATTGKVQLIRGTGTSATVLDSVVYVNNGAVPAPTLGRSLQRQSDLSWALKSAPDPTTAGGITAAAANCYQASNLSARVNELALLCRNGLISGQFIELTAANFTATRESGMRLRTYDRDGVMLSELLDLFGAASGQAWTSGSKWLVALANLKGPQGQAPDRILPAPLDTIAGRVLFTRLESDGHETVLSDVRYGTPSVPRPGYGKSLSYSSGYAENPYPSPEASNGLSYTDPTCDRPLPSSAFVAELQLQCRDGSSATQFVELGVARADERLWQELRLEAFDRDDQLIGAIAAPFGTKVGTQWPSSARWLIATAGFKDAQQRQADSALPFSLDVLGGRVILRDLTMPIQSQVIAEVAYGPGGMATPQPGHSLERVGNSYVEQANPTPIGFAGLSYSDLICGSAPIAVVLREAQFHCTNGSLTGQFLELGLSSGSEIFDPRVQVVLRDHQGAVLHRMTNPFGALSGLAWSSALPWLIATNSYTSTSGVPPDAALPVALDTLGGRIELVQGTNGADVILSSLEYGVSGVPLPVFGNSLSASAGAFIESTPTPTGFNGLAYVADAACGMPFRSGVMLEEIQLQCRSGANEGQFLELRSTLANERFDARHRIRAFDRNDQLIGEFGLSNQSPGGVWSLDKSMLVANSVWTNGSGPDVTLPFTLDIVAGRIEILGPYGPNLSTLLSSLSYGHAGELAVAPGVSFVRNGENTYRTEATPTPTGLTGGVYNAGRCSAAPVAGFRIAELGTSCFLGGDASFIELRAGPQAYHDADVTLIVRDHAGIELGRMSNLFGSYTGTSWPESRRWLFYNQGFSTAIGITGPNLPFALDPAGGSIVMEQVVFTGLVTVDSVRYGPNGEAPLPTPGMSISRAALEGPFTSSYPTPTAPDQALLGVSCFDPTQWPIRVSEFATACADGGPDGQFIELVSLSNGFAYFSTLRLRIHDAAGAILGESSAPFAGFVDEAWPQGTNVLLGNSQSNTCTGTFDAALPAVLDTTGGRIDLVAVTNGIETVVQSVAYGSGQAIPRIPRGESAERQSDGSYVLRSPPIPRNRAGIQAVLLSCDLSIPPVRIEQFALTCASGHPVGQFIQLRATATFTLASTLAIRITQPDNTVAEVALPPSQVGRVWLEGESFLFTSSLWATHLGRCSDGVIPEMRKSLGTIRLIERAGANCFRELDLLTYGPAMMTPVPSPGLSVRRDPSLGLLHEPWPVPMCANGDTTWVVPCLSADPEQTVVVQEFAVLDAAHGRKNQFIELSSSGAGQLSDMRVGLRTYDSNGGVIQDVVGAGLYTYTGLWRPGVPHPILSSTTQIPGAFVYRILAPLDTLGGRIELMYEPSYGGRQLLRGLTYGPGSDVPTPGPGYSSQRMPDGTYRSTARPTPANLEGPLDMTTYPIAGCELASLISSTGQNEPVGTPTFDRLQVIAPTRSTFDKTRGTVSSSAGPGMSARTVATDRFTLDAPPGSSVPLTVRLRTTTNMLCDTTSCADGSTTYSIIFNGATVSRTDLSSGAGTVDLPLTLTAGSSFTLSQQVVATQSPGPGFTRRVFADAQLEFIGIPAGMKITSCSGYQQDQPVPVLLALAEAVATADQARLVWRVDQSAAFEARVQRRDEDSEWLDVGTVRVDGAGQLEFTDGSVLPLHRYGYRLTWTDRERGAISAGEAWLDIPRALAFALHGARPNPSRGALTVAFQLATEGEVRIELLDIAGRRVLEHRVDRMAPGDHMLSLARAGEVAPGMYALRLKQGERSATTRVIITR